MISGRCSVLSTVRCALEFSKIQCYHNRARGSWLTDVPKPISRYQLGRYLPTDLLHFVKMVAASTTASMDNENSAGGTTNRLAFEKSPYLLQHSRNPVEWYPWSHEALERAKQEDKVIFLSIGYSTCHWCHVMEKESFENLEIAVIMNENFINIKVDREERPDLDRLYMTFVQTITGRGGWPLNVFLAPNLTPITGATYFPPEDVGDQPGFKNILRTIAEKWLSNKEQVMLSGNTILEGLKRGLTRPDVNRVLVPEDCGLLCVRQITKSYDDQYGGFSRAPKFPQPVIFNFLFHMYSREPTGEMNKQCLNMCVDTLTKMANGGIHDHIGQGFARYSVDEKWHVPHFEKMLYDQAQLLQSYVDAFLATKETFFLEVIDDITTYVIRDLRHKEGGFYSAEDADSYPTFDDHEKKEGAFYVWSYDEVDSLLNKTVSDNEEITLSDLFCYHYNVKPTGNVEPAQDPHNELTLKNVLIVNQSLEATAEHFGLTPDATAAYLKEARETLFEARLKRPRPQLDDKIITAWNGLMISSMSRAGTATNNKEYIKVATDAACFVEKYLFDKERNILLRSCYRSSGDIITQTSVPIAGFHIDYAFMVRGLLDLYEANFDLHWLEFAEQLQNIQDDLFWDTSAGGYFLTAEDDPAIILRLKDDNDGAEPSSNSTACGNLLRLAVYLNRRELTDKAGQILQALKMRLVLIPIAFPELASACIHHLDSVTQICIVGKSNDDDTDKLIRVVHERLIPGKVFILIDHEQENNYLLSKNEFLHNMKAQNGRPTAYVCRRQSCSLPVTTPEQLAELLNNMP